MLRSVTALVAIALFSLFALGSQYVAMLNYWWFALFRPQDWMWWDVTSLRLPLIAAGLFFAGALVRGAMPRLDSGIAQLVAAFVGLVLISQLLSRCNSHYALTWHHVTILAVAALMTERILTNRLRVLVLVLMVTLSFGNIPGRAGLKSLVTGQSYYDANIGGGGISGSNAVALGSAMSFFLVVFAVQALGRARADGMSLPVWLTGRPSLIGFSALALGLAVFVQASGSRGSGLAFLAGLLVWVLLHPRRVRILALAGAVMVPLVVLVVVPSGYVDRLSSAFVEAEDRDDSAASRPHFWATALDMANGRPFGVGMGCYKINYNRYDQSGGQYGRGRSVHSSHFSVVAELGWIGFAVWTALHAAVLITLWRARRAALRAAVEPDRFVLHLANALFASHVVFLIGASFYEFGYNDLTWVTLALSIACARLLRSERDAARDRIAAAAAASARWPGAGGSASGAPNLRTDSR